MATHTALPVAVIGCGRMGQLHARVYSEMPQTRLVGVYDADPDVAAAAADRFSTGAFPKFDGIAGEVRAVTIAVPTQYHLEVARPFLQRGIACLIEKPLAKDVAEAREIVELARKHNAVVQVGHIERFNPAIRSMGKVGSLEPRFIEVIRISPL